MRFFVTSFHAMYVRSRSRDRERSMACTAVGAWDFYRDDPVAHAEGVADDRGGLVGDAHDYDVAVVRAYG